MATRICMRSIYYYNIMFIIRALSMVESNPNTNNKQGNCNISDHHHLLVTPSHSLSPSDPFGNLSTNPRAPNVRVLLDCIVIALL